MTFGGKMWPEEEHKNDFLYADIGLFFELSTGYTGMFASRPILDFCTLGWFTVCMYIIFQGTFVNYN